MQCEIFVNYMWRKRKLLSYLLTTILIKSVLDKDQNQNHCYYNMFLEKCSYELAKI